MRPFLVLVLDVVVVVVFAALGRRTHDGGGALLGVADTAWPFVVGLLVGHAVVRGATTLRVGAVRTGAVVWATTVVVGMILRQLTGDGTAPAFVVVATAFLGAGFLGGRLVLRAVSRRGPARGIR